MTASGQLSRSLVAVTPANGVSKLKHYFQHFGYITNNPNNPSDDFDDDLESAIKTYQLNFNLETTGTLDDPTLKQLERPRCGVADVINGSTSMNAGKGRTPPPPFSPHANIHTVARYSFFNGARRWSDLTYAFLPENNLTDSVKSLFSRSFDRWSAVIPMTFNQTTSYSGADIKIGIFRGDHGDGSRFDGAGGVLGHAFAPPDGRFHLDGDEEWAMDGGNLNATSYDMETVVMHEIGHVLGLAHSSDAAAVMYPTVAAGKRKVELGNDDIEGIQELYGSNPNYKRVEPTPTYWLVCEA
ncbi:hypothetical protein RHGRI_022282 [Rhododendron griersonianum]|uniref:Peptidase metallopeptidase domain-containing protein n=1 Tax=Rhododendron griersonianum TaxID=479676 RepID=A0AAV6IZ01_9ERIC|nr:hypothetical protein RHGRI_022282 [Rhododendron griersonianum]